MIIICWVVLQTWLLVAIWVLVSCSASSSATASCPLVDLVSWLLVMVSDALSSTGYMMLRLHLIL